MNFTDSPEPNTYG